LFDLELSIKLLAIVSYLRTTSTKQYPLEKKKTKNGIDSMSKNQLVSLDDDLLHATRYPIVNRSLPAVDRWQ